MEYSGPWTSGLLDFLTTLGEHPDPTITAQALLDGPLATFGAIGTLISVVDHPRLNIIAYAGFSEEAVALYRSTLLSTDLPLSRSVLENEVIITSVDGIAREYPELERDDALREQMSTWEVFGSVISAPIVLRGLAVGAFGFTCREDRSWHTLEIASLDAISASLGIWLTHPNTPGVPRRSADDEQPPHHLTDRQRRILSLVHHGRSTASIARELGISDSTVKQDLSRASRELGATSRADAANRALAEGLLP